jgi:uncharacterized DUF497 family protein
VPGSEIEFEWDGENRRHLAAHGITPAEFEQLLTNDPLEMAYEMIDEEERYRSVGITARGRLLSAAWTIRDGRIRAITSFRASISDKKAFRERTK